MAKVDLFLDSVVNPFEKGAIVKANDGDVIGIIVLQDGLYNVLTLEEGEYCGETYFRLEAIFPEPTDLFDIEVEFSVVVESSLVNIKVERGN